MAVEAPSDAPQIPDAPPPATTEGRRGSHSHSEPRLFGGRVGLAIMALGLLVIGFGWYGISGRGAQIDGSTDVRAQLPYLISGGFLGLSLVIIGAAVFLAHTTRLERARADALVEARFAHLSSGLGLATPAPTATEGLVVTGNAAYHLADCRLVDGREGQEYVTVDAAEANGLRPCRICLG